MSWPKPSDLWELSPTDFNKWRRENDLKQLFQIFKVTLLGFDEWLAENNISVEFILGTDIPGQFFYYDKVTYLVKTTKGANTHYFFNLIESVKHEKRVIQAQSIKHEGESSEWFRIIPYFKWVKNKYKNQKPIKTKYSGELDTFRFIGGVAPDVPEMCSAAIAPGISVLKLGGIRIDGWGKTTHRNLDFTNLDFLEIEGKHHWDIEHMICYSSCRHLKFTNVEVNFTKFYACHFENLILLNSRFYWIEFYDCDLFGASFENSSLINLIIEKSSISKLSFSKVEVDYIIYIPPKKEWHTTSLGTYKTIADNYKRFRLLFQSNGLRKETADAYYYERKFEMYYSWELLDFKTKFNRMLKQDLEFTALQIRDNFKLFRCMLADLLSFLIWGFGEKPVRTLLFSLFILIFYTIIYYNSGIPEYDGDIINSAYLSLEMFTTLGFGESDAFHTVFKIILCSEALIGAFVYGLFIAGYANKSKY